VVEPDMLTILARVSRVSVETLARYGAREVAWPTTDHPRSASSWTASSPR
jgi:hypothetical protein